MSVIFTIGDVGRSLIFVANKLLSIDMVDVIWRKMLSIIALSMSTIIFITLIYGIIWGKYQFKYHHQLIASTKIPPSFNDYRIVQFSDVHLGSFDRMEPIKKIVEEVNQLKPDLIVFTGDLVNFRAKEALKYIELFSLLHAKDGVYTIMGNHDYKMTDSNSSVFFEKDKEAMLKIIQQKMGFTWLNNQSVEIYRGKDTICLGGVENWGGNHFVKFGDVDKAFDKKSDSLFKILLSHDPTYWKEVIAHKEPKIDLTLSGHTHGMQVGIEMGKSKWSPVKYIYPLWAGIYNENGTSLYVNRGFGVIGYPGRIGIWPEITILTLKHK